MKNPFDNLDKILENRVRLQIISVLVANDSYNFNGLKDLLSITDGNLATNIKALEKERYISVTKAFVGRKPNTTYRATERGRAAFRKHLEAMAELVRIQSKK